MLSALQRAVTQPATFFETESEDPSLGPPVVVVGLVAVAGILGSIPTVLAVNRALPAEAGLFAAIGFLFGSITAVIGPFVSWVIVATLLFIGAVLAGGDGAFRDLFALAGWGFAPRIVVPLVGGVVAFLLLSGTNFSDPQQARRLSQTATTGTLGLVSQGVNAVMFIWAGWMWTHAIASTQNLTTRTAGVVSGAVVLLQLLVNLGLSLLSASLV